jgi:hypothetical protein
VGYKRWVFTLGIVLIGLVITRSLFWEQYRVQHSAVTQGTLLPYAKGKATKPVLELADSWVTIPFDKQPGGQWEVLRNEPITVEVLDGTPMFSTIIRDKSGATIVDVQRNRWIVSSSASIVWDKNYTDDTLEVLDVREKVVLSVRILPDRVQLQGEWHDEKGRGIRIAQTHPPLIEGGAQIMSLQAFDDDPPMLKIAPRFQYPSAEHWRELRTKQP